MCAFILARRNRCWEGLPAAAVSAYVRLYCKFVIGMVKYTRVISMAQRVLDRVAASCMVSYVVCRQINVTRDCAAAAICMLLICRFEGVCFFNLKQRFVHT